MHIKIKRIDKTLPLPEYQTVGAVAFDLYSRIDTHIAPKTIVKIPTNLVVQVPQGYLLAIVTRSSTAVKKGLSLLQGFGIVDQDYCGPEDELLYQVYNFTDNPVTITRGERIGQAAFLRADQMQWEEVEEMTAPNRGGFGTTG
jgi:dUTP pyrophosphatase